MDFAEFHSFCLRVGGGGGGMDFAEFKTNFCKRGKGEGWGAPQWISSQLNV